MTARTKRLADELERSCLFMRTRRLARTISEIYDDALRPVGLKGSQFALLVAVASADSVRRIDIGAHMHIDPSTLTRNLRVMELNGWIESCADPADARSSPVRVTNEGAALLERAAPAWRVAQRRASKLLGPESRHSLMTLVDGLAEAT